MSGFGSRVGGALRRTWPNRVVTRDVQGVRLALPWSHRLPDYATQYPTYGQNLVAVAEALGRSESAPFVVIDVGANVGDSALQILATTDARVLCVEGDEYWLDYLHRNVDGDDRIRVVPALLLPDDAEQVTARRHDGTTQFMQGGDGKDAASAMSPDALRSANGDLGRVRLVKSDTDGYDVKLVPALARAWSDEHPVLFFEYDPGMTRGVGDDAPEAVWAALADLGYEHVVVWDNFGNPLGSLAIDEAAAAGERLDEPLEQLGYHYWDVAVVHRSDAALRPVLDELVGSRVLDPGAGRRA